MKSTHATVTAFVKVIILLINGMSYRLFKRVYKFCESYYMYSPENLWPNFSKLIVSLDATITTTFCRKTLKGKLKIAY